MRIRRPATRARSERGANLVEAAIALPVLMLLMFGIIEWSMVREQDHALSHGVREGARRAVVAEWGTDTSCTGVAAGGWAGTVPTICATKAAIDESNVAVKIIAPTYAVGELVTVCAQRPTDTITGLMEGVLGAKVLQAQTSMRIEELGAGGITSIEEPAGDWSWCVQA